MVIDPNALARALDELAFAAAAVAHQLRQYATEQDATAINRPNISAKSLTMPTHQRGFRVAKPVIQVILRNPEKVPRETYDICRAQGINTTQRVVQHLRRYVRNTIKAEIEIKGGEPLPDGEIETSVARIVLTNLAKNRDEIALLCRDSGIPAKPSTIKNVYEYTRLTHSLIAEHFHPTDGP